MATLWRDIQFGLRILRNRVSFTVVAIFTLAVGIAVNTTVFSWIDSVLLSPYPAVARPSELLVLETVTSTGRYLVSTSYQDYRDYRDNLKLLDGLAVARHTPMSIGPEGRTERAWGELVSGNYFKVLGVNPVLGRTFLPEESADRPGAFPVAVISYRMWQKRFRGDPSIVGRIIRLNRREIAIIGVAPRDFRGTLAGLTYDVWMPVTMATAMGTGGGTLTFRATRDLTTTLARLKPGVTLDQARQEVAALAGRLSAAYPATNRGIGATLNPVWAAHNGAQILLLRPLYILMAVCLLILLIVCANVANLLLARAVARRRELSVRLVLGAGRWRLVRQLLTETLLLSGAGAVAGVILAMWMATSLAYLLPPNDLPVTLDSGLSVRTLLFSVLVAVLATVLSGTVPALLSVRQGFNEALKEGARSGASAHSHRLRGALVSLEVALATIALIGAGLFYRSFRNTSAIHPGFDSANISASQFYLSYSGYSAAEQRLFCRTLRERLESLPGVIGVSYSDVTPLSFGSSPYNQIDVEGYIPARNEDVTVHRALVPPGYFNLLGIRLLEGRDFTEHDDETAPVAIVVNRTFVRRFFSGTNPIGRAVRLDSRWGKVVGVVADVKYHSLAEAPMPYFYAPFRQIYAPGLNFAFLLKTVSDPLRMADTMRREALALNPDAIFSATLLAEASGASLYPQKVAATLLSALGALSLLLAALGLYSVMAYAVSQRTHEFGVRIALGAGRRDLVGLVVRQGLMLTVPGLALGMVGTLAAARLVRGMLIDVGSADPATFAAAAVFLAAVSVLASYLPALRATRVDPATALRCQ